jgi:nitric oxide reductase NorD protein
MALVQHSGLERSSLNAVDQQQLAAALAGLPATHHETLLDVLSQVNAQILRQWLGSGVLHEWVKQGLHLLAEKRERLATALFAATPTTLPVLTYSEMSDWVRLCLDIRAAEKPDLFAVLPSGLSALGEPERQNLYRLVRTTAYHTPQVAAALYRTLPHNVQSLSVEQRGLLFRCLQAAVTFDPEPLPALLPLLGPTLRSLAPESREPLLQRIAQLAQTFPAGVARLFRALTRAYEEVGEEGVKSWIATGEEVARRNPEAGEAFFALESRTSLLALRHSSPAVALSDVQGLLIKYLHMLSGSAVSLKEAETLSLPPPLAEGVDFGFPLPAFVEVFPTYEENFRLYRVLAAHQAGRVEFDTYSPELPLLWPHLPDFVHQLVGDATEIPQDLASYFRLFPQPELIDALFLFLEGKRIAARLAASYHGLRADLAWADSLTHLLPPILTPFRPRLPETPWAHLQREATVYDSLVLATDLYAALRPATQTSAALPESMSQEEGMEDGEATQDAANIPLEVDEDGPGADRLSAEEQEVLRKIAAALRDRPRKKRVSRKGKAVVVIEMDADSATEGEEPEEMKAKKKKALDRRLQTNEGLRYLYDEWDYVIDDYRTQWCQLRELPLGGDEGAFFSRTVADYAYLTPSIKREFQRLRPRMYRHVKGLEDGDEIDLEAAVTARVDLRTGTAPSTRLYAARQPLERDVAALFLLDMSASTDMRLPEREDVRIIDIMKEAVVLLSAALEDIGDFYAIYGFSSHGRRNVEVYPVKTFAEALSPGVKSRIGGIVPRHSTRMGTAVRHATRKLKDVSSRARLLVLLSDGHPEDADYGRDKHAPTYGLRDTMMALREAEKHGILSFCLTVDKGGHDYLREMCAPSRYMVIDDILSLPAELPKIYQRHIRAQSV